MGKGTNEMAENGVYVKENDGFIFEDNQEAFPKETGVDLNETEKRGRCF